MGESLRDERGSILIWAAAGLATLIAFAGLATDLPYLYVARQQAQTAADAGALAGAYALFLSEAKAVADAKAFAGRTPIIGQLLTPEQVDVSLSSNGGSTPDGVRCVTYRDVTHRNPMQLFMLPVLQLFGLGRTTADVAATATARLVNTCSSDCFKPWSPPDRWIDRDGNGEFDPAIDTYTPPTEPGATGYRYPADQGVRVVLKVGSPSETIVPSIFYPVDFPAINRGTPLVGADAYRENILTCAPGTFVSVGDQLKVEPGNMVGPTQQGVQALIDQDPTAFWDPECNCLNSPLGVSSPRLVRISFFDPRYPVMSGRKQIVVGNVGGFFLEGLTSEGDVIGRYTLVPSRGGTPNAVCSLLKAVQLVQ
ncbi:MAG: hypothetical protein HY726_19195 [Candidatus Rokubacteria bacterium]|nr:hypothetical protein [Candidatus Rokubacteria bacterium]